MPNWSMGLHSNDSGNERNDVKGATPEIVVHQEKTAGKEKSAFLSEDDLRWIRNLYGVLLVAFPVLYFFWEIILMGVLGLFALGAAVYSFCIMSKGYDALANALPGLLIGAVAFGVAKRASKSPAVKKAAKTFATGAAAGVGFEVGRRVAGKS